MALTEFELKLEVPANQLVHIEAYMRTGKVVAKQLHAYYFDTKEGALRSKGVVLRLRKEGSDWVQTAKSTLPKVNLVTNNTNSTFERLEDNVNILNHSGAYMPEIILARHMGKAVGDAILKALNLKSYHFKRESEIPKLVKVYETDVKRLTREIQFNGTTLELALDQGKVTNGIKSLALCELEIELKKGKAEDAVLFAQACCKNYGLWLSCITKSMKGQRLSQASANQVLIEPNPKFTKHYSGNEIAMTVLEFCLKQVIANASELADGRVDNERVHQLRVSIRRLRTALQEFKILIDGIHPAWEFPLIDAFRDLGDYRDYFNFIESVLPKIKAAGGPTIEVGNVKHGIKNPVQVIRSNAFQHGLLTIIAFTLSMPANTHIQSHQNLSSSKTKKVISKRLEKIYTQLIGDSRNFLALDESQQHKVRKRLKRLRYLVEFCGSLYSNAQIKTFISKVKPAQDALGLYNDELIALKTYVDLSSKDKLAYYGVGWLSARSTPNAVKCLKQLKSLNKIQPFWK